MTFAANKTSTEALLWDIEAISSEYGLHLNKTKCVALSIGGGEGINSYRETKYQLTRKRNIWVSA